jgi:FkbM family methyltransferase
MKVTTRTKISLAAVLARQVISVRALFGKGPEGQFKRRGINWALDLREGIDFAIYLLGGFELSTRAVYRKLLKPGAIVLDVGANIGAHTLPLASCISRRGRVHAFEATEFAVGKLRKNLSLNPKLESRVTVHHCLLTDGSDDHGITQIYSSWPLHAKAGERHPQHGGRLEETGTAAQFSLDQFIEQNLIDRIDLIKLDVDGFEWQILQGSIIVFETFHPPVLLELAPDYEGVQIEDILGFFRQRGYDFFPLGSKHPMPRDAAQIRAKIPPGGSINVLARVVDDPASRTRTRDMSRSRRSIR